MCFPWPAQDGPCQLVVKNSRVFWLTALLCLLLSRHGEERASEANCLPVAPHFLGSVLALLPTAVVLWRSCSLARSLCRTCFLLPALPLDGCPEPVCVSCIPCRPKPACWWQNFKLRAKEMSSASKDSIAAQMALDSGTGLTCCFLLCCHKATKKIFAMPPPSQRARATYRREEGLLAVGSSEVPLLGKMEQP